MTLLIYLFKGNVFMKSICGANCEKCGYGQNNGCAGCEKTGGCPFGKQCFIAQYIKLGGKEAYEVFKRQLMDEFNQLGIPGMPTITELDPIIGAYVNLAYPLPDGKEVSLLNDNEIYLATQVHCEFNDELIRCYGLVAAPGFLLVAEYGENGSDPEIVMYKRR